jgi:hypothetical protein
MEVLLCCAKRRWRRRRDGELGKTRFTWKGTWKLGMWQMDSLLLRPYIDAGLLVLSVRQGSRTSSRTRGWGPIDRFVQGRIWGFEDYLLERMTLEPLLADQRPLSSPARRITPGRLVFYFTDGGMLLYWVISALRRDDGCP